ncbi:hypothetical protein ACFV23_00525 [Streptomyces sp. NPDC059627]
MELPTTVHLPAASPAHHQSLLMLSVEGSSTWAARPVPDGLAPGGVLRWGSEPAFAAILQHRPAMILLNAPATEVDVLTRLVRAACLIAPVALLRQDRADAVAALDAGACDVLDSRAQPVELVWRIRADLRRCPPTASAPACPSGTASQRLLFDVLARSRAVVCCHELRLLLGTPAMPITLRALKARIKRLEPAFRQQGLDLVVDQQWGLATYRTQARTSTGASGQTDGTSAAAPTEP